MAGVPILSIQLPGSPCAVLKDIGGTIATQLEHGKRCMNLPRRLFLVRLVAAAKDLSRPVLNPRKLLDMELLVVLYARDQTGNVSLQ